MKWPVIPSISVFGSLTTLVKGLALTILAIVLWSFAGKRQQSKTCNKIDVRIENEEGNYFVDQAQIESAISLGKNNLVYMRWFDSISLYKLERKIEKIDFVKKAEVSHDLAGNLRVNVKLIRPIARIVSGGSDKDRYLGNDGEILPTSEKYSANVITMDGPGARHMVFHADSNAREVVKMVEFINHDPFWKAQIAHIYVDENWELTLYPLVGSQLIEFGAPTDFESKFNKINAFYQRIVPVKGWNAYRKVSVKYKNQIICEKTS